MRLIDREVGQVRKPLWGKVAFSALVALGVLLPAGAHATVDKKKPPPKPKLPDLVVTSAKLQGKWFTFRGEPLILGSSDVTENVGAATAQPSVTAIVLVATTSTGKPKYKTGARVVRKLGPGKADAAGQSTTAHIGDIPLGAYHAWICADRTSKVKESDENNNCKYVGRHYFLKRTWHGHVWGNGLLFGPEPDAVERWDVADASLVFVRPGKWSNGHKVFVYTFKGTSVYQTSGHWQNGCTFSGSGSASVADNLVTLEYDDEWYRAYAMAVPASYTIHGTCPDGDPFDLSGPINTAIWDIGRTAAPVPDLPFGAETLEGYSSSTAPAEWHWKFT